MIGMILSCFSFSQKGNNDLGLLLNREWQYTYKSSQNLSEKIYKELLSSSNRRKQKKLLKNREEMLPFLKEMCLMSKFIYEKDSITTYLPGQVVKKACKYFPERDEIVTSPNDSLERRISKIISIGSNHFSFLIQDSVRLTMVPALTKIDSSHFDEIKTQAVFYGNPTAETVIVNTQGGPVSELFEDEFVSVIRNSGMENQLYVNVHQEQTKLPENFRDQEISFRQAVDFDRKSVARLQKVIEYFKSQGKKVYVLGISFGAFMTQELLAEYGSDLADAYYIMVGRLNIDSKMWKAFSEGKNGMFLHRAKGEYKIRIKNQKNILDRNMSKLAAGLGHYRYIKKLDHIRDLSKVCYVYGLKDEQVGRLTEAEVEFLEERRAKVVAIEKGTHDSAINEGIKLLKSLNNEKSNTDNDWLSSRSYREFLQL
jgi:hypothetical protein